MTSGSSFVILQRSSWNVQSLTASIFTAASFEHSLTVRVLYHINIILWFIACGHRQWTPKQFSHDEPLSLLGHGSLHRETLAGELRNRWRHTGKYQYRGQYNLDLRAQAVEVCIMHYLFFYMEIVGHPAACHLNAFKRMKHLKCCLILDRAICENELKTW
jgi:hypothetical protein